MEGNSQSFPQEEYPPMPLILLGFNHKIAPVDIREKFSFSDSMLRDALTSLVDGCMVEEGVILSTCNRTEVYTFGPSGRECLEKSNELLAAHGSSTHPPIHDFLYSLADEEAVKHLFEVACGLDSMIIG